MINQQWEILYSRVVYIVEIVAIATDSKPM